MSKLTSKAVAAIDELTVDDDTRANTRTQCDHDEVFHATSHAVDHLTDSGGISIVGQSHRNAQTLLEHSGQRHNSIMAPRQVGSKLDGAVIIVAVRCTNTHCLDHVDASHLFDDRLQSSHASVHVVFHFVVALSLDSGSGLDLATTVNNTEDGVCSAQIQTDHIRFQCLLCIHTSYYKLVLVICVYGAKLQKSF